MPSTDETVAAMEADLDRNREHVEETAAARAALEAIAAERGEEIAAADRDRAVQAAVAGIGGEQGEIPPARGAVPTPDISSVGAAPASEAPGAPPAAEEAPGLDLEPAEPPKPVLPEQSAWATIQGMAIDLARSNLVPSALRGKPADITIILLAAHDLGISATQALSKIHVIEGKPSMSAELMVALVLRDGHRIGPIEMTAEHAIAFGQRMAGGAPAGEPVRIEFTLDEAKTAKLLSKDVWQKYPKAMLWARAVSMLCRVMFPDVLAGITYVPEELGWIEAEGEEGAAPALSAEEQADQADYAAGQAGRAEIAARIAALSEEARAALREEWEQLARDRVLHPPSQLRESEVAAAEGIVARYEADPDGGRVADAEIVGEAAPREPQAAAEPPEGAFTCESCGNLIRPGSEQTDFSDHAPGCTDAPF